MFSLTPAEVRSCITMSARMEYRFAGCAGQIETMAVLRVHNLSRVTSDMCRRVQKIMARKC